MNGIRPDDELARWRAEWQREDEALPAAERRALRRLVQRRSLGLKLLTAGEVVLGVVLLAFLGRVASTSPHAVDAVVMAGLALLILAAFAFSLWNRRGLWRAESEAPAALVDLLLARCRRRRRGLRFGWALLAAEVALFLPWIWLHLAAVGGTPAAADLLRGYGFLALMAGGAAAALVAIGRWTRREEARLEELRRMVEGRGGDSHISRPALLRR